MTTDTKTEYKKFTTWQSVRKLAQEIGVNFYSDSSTSYEKGNGKGLKWSSFYNDRIYVAGWEKTYDRNSYESRKVYQLAQENFKLKLELWATKNNISYVYINKDDYSSDYIQIVNEAN